MHSTPFFFLLFNIHYMDRCEMKIISIIFSIVIIVFFAINVFDRNRELKILGNVVGENNRDYLTEIDQTSVSSAPVTSETYVYRIKNSDKISCSILEKYDDGQVLIDNFDKKYISNSSSVCSKHFSDIFDREIYILLQNDILIVKVFID